MRRTWQIKPQDMPAQKALSCALGISEILAQILVNRNILDPQEAEVFLKPSLLKLHDPFMMKDMHKAVSRIKKALEKKEHILVYGDYDVDGISASVLLVCVLRHIGAEVECYIPNRLEEGYGLSSKALGHIKKLKIDLLITVDCGITSIDEIEQLNSFGIDTIITDHHHPSEIIPKAFAVINPLQKGCSYPDKNLSGVGVAFKLAAALMGNDSNYLYEHLDLVCLGTVSDVVPLTGENRILVKNGLEQLTHTKKPGLRALIEVVSLKDKQMTSFYVGYILGPRINAMGRLGSPEVSLSLLMCDDPGKAKDLARQLDTENKNRQRLEESVLKEALKKIEMEINFKDNKVIVLDDEGWHRGVIGIVASRLVERFNRPAFMLSVNGSEIKGSARSIRNFHLFDALSECSGLLENYGGHSFAAGLTLKKERLQDFRDRINDIAQTRILPCDLVPSIDIDAEIPISSLNKKLIRELAGLGPFGLGNPKPVFGSRNLRIKSQPVVLRSEGVKMWVTDGHVTAEAIGFRMAPDLPSEPLENEIDIAYTCDLNEYKGITSIQLQLKDIRLSEKSFTADTQAVFAQAR